VTVPNTALQSYLAAALAADPADRSGAHLADFPLRMGSEAPALPAVARPLPGAEWTLAQTLQEVRLGRVALVESSRGVRPRHGHLVTPELARAVARFAGPLRVWLRLGVGNGRVPTPWRAETWDDAVRLHASWFGLVFDPPVLPLTLRAGERVQDWGRYRDGVAARLAAGPTAPGAERLAADLAALYTRFAAPAERVFVPTPTPAIAA